MKIQTRDMTLTVNTLDDGVLSSVGDVALMDVSDLKNVSLYVNRVSDKAILDLGDVTVHVDTVIISKVSGDAPTISFAAGAGAGAGTIVEDLDLKTIVITFKTAVSTVADIEALLATSDLVDILTAGTPANVLAVVDDDFAATPLAANAATFTVTVEKSPDGVSFSTVDTVDQTDLPDGTATAKELTLSDSHGMPTIAKQLRITLTAMTGGAAFSAVAAGA